MAGTLVTTWQDQRPETSPLGPISGFDPTMDQRSNRRAPLRRAAAVAAVIGVLALAGCAKSDDAGSTPLPETQLVDLRTGKAADWDTDGKPLVVNLWASWCAPCKAEMPAIQRVSEKLGDQVAIVGVTDQKDLDAARKAAENAGVSYPLRVDEAQELQTDLGVVGLPATVFVDADGKIVGRHQGVLTEAKLLKEIEDRYGITA